MSDIYKDYLMHSQHRNTTSRWNRREKPDPQDDDKNRNFHKNQKASNINNVHTIANRTIKEVTNGYNSTAGETMSPSRRRHAAQDAAETREKMIKRKAEQEREQARKDREADAYRSAARSNQNKIKTPVSAKRSKGSDAAANSGRYNTGNRMFSSFPNRNGGKSSESFWNSILQKARNNHQYIRMMTPNGEMSMSPEYWEELFGNGENAANYTYLGFGVTYAGRNTGYRPLNR